MTAHHKPRQHARGTLAAPKGCAAGAGRLIERLARCLE